MYSASCPDCGYVVGEFNGNNTYGPFYVWCSAQNPGCTPDITSGGGYIGLFADVPSCIGAGGTPFYWWSAYAESGLYPCLANTGSLPINIETIYGTRSIFSSGGLKGLISGKVNGRNTPLVIGNDTTKYSEAILPYYGNDIVVKYNTRPKTKPQLNGESHRIALTGLTEGNTRGYAYVQGDSSEKKLLLPYNTITAIRVTGIVTVIGGSSSTYTLGKTEAFAYYTAFKNFRGAITQLSTAGGQQEFSMREGANPTTCTLYITTNNYELQFGLDDSQTGWKTSWERLFGGF